MAAVNPIEEKNWVDGHSAEGVNNENIIGQENFWVDGHSVEFWTIGTPPPPVTGGGNGGPQIGIWIRI